MSWADREAGLAGRTGRSAVTKVAVFALPHLVLGTAVPGGLRPELVRYAFNSFGPRFPAHPAAISTLVFLRKYNC